MRIALSVFLVLHGVAHLVGFAGAWRFDPTIPAQSSLFGRIQAGPGAMKAIGIAWLLTGLVFVAAGVGGMTGAPWVAAVVAGAAAASLILSISAMPGARIGVAIDVAILTAFVIAGSPFAQTAVSGPVSSVAQGKISGEDFTLRIGGPATIAQGSSAGVVWVIGNHAEVQGTVHELFVIDGTALIEGTVTGNIVLVGARGELKPGARVGGDVLLYRSDFETASGAAIAGSVHNEAGVSFGASALWMLWASVTIALILVGVGLAYVAGPALGQAAETLTQHKRESALTALLLLVGLPVAAIMSFMTGVGFVLGLLILFAIIPVVAFGGYFIASVAIGKRLARAARPDRPAVIYGAVAIGVLALQMLAIVPVLGGLILLLSGQAGAGALIYRAWARERSEHTDRRLIIQPA